jgi:hypothetical protein
MSKPKEYFGQCGWHYGKQTDGIRIVELTHNGKEWQSAIAICSNCRGHLRGFFRYPTKKVCPGWLGLLG